MAASGAMSFAHAGRFTTSRDVPSPHCFPSESQWLRHCGTSFRCGSLHRIGQIDELDIEAEV